ncbi:MAG: DUF2634 domain-containing protein [Paraclostridium sp.]
MIPVDNDFNLLELEIKPQSSKTYALLDSRIEGICDEVDALKQSIYLILNTDRFTYPIYSWNYGVELNDLIGQPTTYVIPILENRIKEALLQDDRILDINNFEYDIQKKTVHTKFTVNSIYGDIESMKEVDI